MNIESKTQKESCININGLDIIPDRQTSSSRIAAHKNTDTDSLDAPGSLEDAKDDSNATLGEKPHACDSKSNLPGNIAFPGRQVASQEMCIPTREELLLDKDAERRMRNTAAARR